MINDPAGSQTATRTPRVRVLNNGAALAGVVSASVQQSNHYQASHFTLEFAVNAGPVNWWDVQPPLLVEVDFSLDGTGWTTAITGEVDHLTVNWQTGTLTAEGRDLTARMIEAKTNESFQNKTSSEIATIIAGRHGLTAKVTATTTLAGRYYEQDHTHTTSDQFSKTTTEWDLLVYLAQREGFDLFVQGTTLYFQTATAPNADPFVVQWTPPSPVPRLNVVTLRAQRSLTLAKDIEVWVRSWNSKQKRGFTKIIKAAGTKAASASGQTPGPAKQSTDTQRYVYVRPNLTEQQALQLGQQMLAQLTRHERTIDVDMPGELTLTPRNMVRLQGTGSSFDQAYYVESIDRSISFGEGFRQTLRLKNSSPLSQTQVQ